MRTRRGQDGGVPTRSAPTAGGSTRLGLVAGGAVRLGLVAGSGARLAAGGAVAAALILAAGCGTAAAGGPVAAGPVAPGPGAPPLDLSLADRGGTSWAVVEMGGRSAQDQNFWQVFVRRAGVATWRLATPAGVADNGGVVIASTGAGALVAGFRPSQDLTFSPLAATSDAGARWAPGGPVSPGLSDVPGALAAGPGDQLIAVTDGGQVELGRHGGTQWTRLASVRGVAATAAGRACGLSGVTAAAFAPDGGPLLGGTCGQPGVAGIFARRGGTWRAAGPALPAALASRDVTVLRLGSVAGPVAGGAPGSVPGVASGASRSAAGSVVSGAPGSASAVVRAGGGVAGGGSVALLAVGRGAGAGVIAAWAVGGGRQWRLSPVLRTGPLRIRSASLWPDGSAGLVLSGPHGERGATIAGPGAPWSMLPALPAGAATLARGAGGVAEALTVDRSIMRAWRLGQGDAGWAEFQQVRVSIPYGSSG
jgi:hypothetical protein